MQFMLVIYVPIHFRKLTISANTVSCTAGKNRILAKYAGKYFYGDLTSASTKKMHIGTRTKKTASNATSATWDFRWNPCIESTYRNIWRRSGSNALFARHVLAHLHCFTATTFLTPVKKRIRATCVGNNFCFFDCYNSTKLRIHERNLGNAPNARNFFRNKLIWKGISIVFIVLIIKTIALLNNIT